MEEPSDFNNLLTGDVGLITDLISQMVSHAQEDRARMREIQEDNHRIWQYLLTQSGNGHNPLS